MDFSKEYIKMCRKATEIQELWEPKKGDAYILGIDICYLGCHWQECIGCQYEVNELRGECIWLPRQDQLQDMVQTDGHKSTLIVHLINWMQDNIKYFKDAEPEEQYPTDSLEQLWLAFVMYEKYQKMWLKNRWVKK